MLYFARCLFIFRQGRTAVFEYLQVAVFEYLQVAVFEYLQVAVVRQGEQEICICRQVVRFHCMGRTIYNDMQMSGMLISA